jgi:15-cis-phytoene synthase
MTSETETTYPDIRDPRVMVAVPRERRAAIAALWALARILQQFREPFRERP